MESEELQNAQIVMVTHEFFPRKAGISTYAQEMARCAAEMGFQVEVWAPRHDRLREKSFPYGIRELPLKGGQGWMDRIKLGFFFWRHRKFLADKILYLPEPGPLRAMMYLQWIPAISWKKLIITLHGSEILRFSAPFHRRWLFLKLLQKVDKIGVVSRFCRNLLVEKFPPSMAKTVLTCGALRSDLKISSEIKQPQNNRIILLTVGRITPRKGQLRVLQGLGLLPIDVLEKIEYWLAGPARSRAQKSYLREIERYSSGHGIRIRRWGEVDDSELGEIYAGADIFLIASQLHKKSVEGFGLVCLEASGQGLPVVATRSGGMEESVLDGETGILVTPGDSRELAKVIQKLCEDKTLRQKLGNGGRAHTARFTWKHNVNALFKGYER